MPPKHVHFKKLYEQDIDPALKQIMGFLQIQFDTLFMECKHVYEQIAPEHLRRHQYDPLMGAINSVLSQSFLLNVYSQLDCDEEKTMQICNEYLRCQLPIVKQIYLDSIKRAKKEHGGTTH